MQKMSHPSVPESTPVPTKDARIVIVGASLLGLSTALHLSSRGYHAITLLDRRPNPSPPSSSLSSSTTTTTTNFAPLHYTSQYHALSLAALKTWAQWNESIWSSSPDTQQQQEQEQQQQQDRLWINNGFYTLFATPTPSIPETALQKITYLERRHGLKLALLASSEPDHVDSAVSRMFCIDPFQLELAQHSQRDKEENTKGGGSGVLDTLGGTILVDAAWTFAIDTLKSAQPAVQLVFDQHAGHVERILPCSESEGAEGRSATQTRQGLTVQTKKGTTYEADFIIWACDPSGPLEDVITVPLPKPTQQQHQTSLATTKKTILEIQLSPDETPDLWDRFSEDNFPSWTYTLPPSPSISQTGETGGKEGGGGGILTGFPRDANGTMRIEFRSPTTTTTTTTNRGAYNHPTDHDINIPPEQQIRSFLATYLPDLLPLPQTITTQAATGLHHKVVVVVVDRPPPPTPATDNKNKNNILLALDRTLPFMFLPVIGAAVADILEGKPHTVKGWRWPRSSPNTSPKTSSKTASSSSRL